MAHLHLTWELGGGLGHAGRLKPLAQALRARGHQVSLSLRDLVHTHELLADLDLPCFQAPVWLHRAMGLPSQQASLAEILLTCGYLEPQALAGLVQGWRALFQTLKPDLLVLDYAPTAVLAARSLGLPCVSLGIGFYLPSAEKPLPCLRDWEAIPSQRLQASEARLLATSNAVLASHGAPPLRHAAELFRGDRALLCTWPELDHYGREEPGPGEPWYGPNFLPQTGGKPQWPAGAGPKVFAYLKSDHPDHVALLQALVSQGCRVICYLPEVASGRPAPVQSPLLTYAPGPVSLSETMQDCQLCVCHGGEATLVQSLLAGVPVLLLPMQTEQFLMSRRVARTGAGINAAELPRPQRWPQLVQALLQEPRYRTNAAAFAKRYEGFTQGQQVEALLQVFEQMLARDV